MTDGEVRVECVLPASPEAVFDAWTSPDSLRVWMAPDPLTVAAADCDPRIGGAFRIVMIGADGAFEHTGRYLELDRPNRLSFTWRSAATGLLDTQVTVELDEHPAGTRMVIVHTGLSTRSARDSHRGGWTGIADKLATALAA